MKKGCSTERKEQKKGGGGGFRAALHVSFVTEVNNKFKQKQKKSKHI